MIPLGTCCQCLLLVLMLPMLTFGVVAADVDDFSAVDFSLANCC